MEIETLKAKLPHAKNFRSPDCTQSVIYLTSLITSMKQSSAWENGELSSSIILKSPYKQIILTAIHEGTEIDSFQSDDSIAF